MLAEPQVYADEEFQGLRDDLQGRQHRPRNDPDLFGVWAGLVTRVIPAKTPEFRSPRCVEALVKELSNLRKRG
eukprot:7951083-Heterocapsa_arctica.AAC.1